MRISARKRYSFIIKPLFWLQKRHYGEVLNPALLWGRRPTLFLLVAGFFGFLDRKKSPIPSVLRSLICVRVSQLNDCAFCIDANAMKLAQRGACVDKIEALSQWQNSALFSEQEQSVLSYVEAMTITGERVTQPLIDALKIGFDEDAIVEITALIAFQNLSAKFNTALDVPAQGFCNLPIAPQSPPTPPDGDHHGTTTPESTASTTHKATANNEVNDD